ncbi:unnamed protein product [Phaedon cochleariae]|uniref:Uncharacterized protein n=1 Tax=Phaedon cochleariae TaxID=80249 RepID=A0A9N9SKQ0_PHACE|nr:unnamed protein product [Phaedon cochleariae]
MARHKVESWKGVIGEWKYTFGTRRSLVASTVENFFFVMANSKRPWSSGVGFIAVTDCSAAGLKTDILNLTKEYGIDLTKCRGQGCDGANVMSGVYGGLQTLIKEHAPNADYVHCAAHALNLVLNDAARHVREVLTFFDNLEKIYTFFGNSIKRWAMLSDDPSEKYLITLKKIPKKRRKLQQILVKKKNIHKKFKSKEKNIGVSEHDENTEYDKISEKTQIHDNKEENMTCSGKFSTQDDGYNDEKENVNNSLRMMDKNLEMNKIITTMKRKMIQIKKNRMRTLNLIMIR